MKNSTLSTRIETSKVLAEKINGRAALIGVIALLGAYSSTGQIIPGYL
ncbi:high light inducible protein [Prochlorococcus marinus]|nr:high light inducible protein [Prochlorococcus marinus]